MSGYILSNGQSVVKEVYSFTTYETAQGLEPSPGGT
jgi:hypothetical protein